MLNFPKNLRLVQYVCRKIGFDVKNYMVSLIRGFPQDLLRKLRYQPCTALLVQMQQRFDNIQMSDLSLVNTKGNYVRIRLPEEVIHVGSEAKINNYWIFPVAVDEPEEVVKVLNALGVDAYSGATQTRHTHESLGETSEVLPTRSQIHRGSHYLLANQQNRAFSGA